MSINRSFDGDSNVPCNGCTLCCRRDAVRLLPGDNASLYHTVPHEWITGQLMLAHKPNGDCMYLADNGCTIQTTKPRMCREMDCRNIAAQMGYTKARKMNIVAVWKRGKQLIKEAA